MRRDKPASSCDQVLKKENLFQVRRIYFLAKEHNMCTSVVTSFSFFHPGNKLSLRLMIVPWTNRISLQRTFISKCTISWEKSQKVIKSRRWLNLHFQSRFKFIIIILIIGFRFFLLPSALQVNSHLWLEDCVILNQTSSSSTFRLIPVSDLLVCIVWRKGWVLWALWNGENFSYWGRTKQSVYYFYECKKICGWTVGFHLTAFDLIASILLRSASFSSKIPTFSDPVTHRYPNLFSESEYSSALFSQHHFLAPFLPITIREIS